MIMIDRRQFLPRVDPQDFLRDWHLDRADFLILTDQNSDHIGQVIFALCVLIPNPREGFKKRDSIKNVNAGVDLARSLRSLAWHRAARRSNAVRDYFARTMRP